ncbi:MAG TPA: hypothetical protein VGM30_00980 [Puia sp.]
MRDRRIRYWLSGLLAAGLFIQPGSVYSQDSLRQGIEGTVYRVGGNHMPDPHHRSGPPVAVRSTVYIFELTNISQVLRQGSSPYYTAVRTRLIKPVDTDDKGHFQVWLPPGDYSLFTKKGDLFYGSRRDEKNNIAPVEVLPGKVTPVECRVESDHSNVY